MALAHIGFAAWFVVLSTAASSASTAATPAITGGHPTNVATTLPPVGNTGAGGSAQTPPASQSTPNGLAGTAWNAIELYGTAVAPLEARRPHLVFGPSESLAAGRLAGADGCNSLGGPYTVKGNGITLGQLRSTAIACPQTAEITTRFRAALQGTSHWSIVKERLEFYGATGTPLAVFERRPAAGDALRGTSWQLVKFVGGDDRILTPDDQAKYTIEFAGSGGGGLVAARIDCNRGRGTWRERSAGQLELGALTLTRATCPEGSLHDQIAKQWTNVRSFVMRDGHLFLSLVADGGTYEFAPLSTKKP
jgi:heat shock protein HslJ